MKSKNLLVAILVIAVGAGGFLGGMKFQQGKQPTFSRQFGTGQGPAGTGGQQQNRARMGGGQVIDEIISQDESSITVKLPNGSSRIILVGDSVQINKSAPGSKDDLTKGTQVFVTGSENPDGSLTAQNIQINPTMPARQ